MPAKIDYSNCSYPIRPDLIEAQKLAWQRLAAPGDWLDGERRIQVAAETRHAIMCRFCLERKDALSPFSVTGTHDALDELSAIEVDVIHRIVTDSGRLSEDWVKDCLAKGLSEEEFIEILSIICVVMMTDTFATGLGLNLFPLPEPEAGEPTRYKAPGAKDHDAWIKFTQPEDIRSEDGDVYDGPFAPPVIKALSLLPNAKRFYWEAADQHYLPASYISNPDIDVDIRAINRVQIEIVATRVSSLHQCLY